MARSAISKNRAERGFCLRRQARNFENMTLVVRRKQHFREFLAMFWLLNSLQKEVF